MSDQQLVDMHQRAVVDPAPPDAWGAYSTPAQTLVIDSHLGAPCNCATASPDGQWIAAVGDQPWLSLLHVSEGYGMECDSKTGLGKSGAGKGVILKFNAKQPYRPSRRKYVRRPPGLWGVVPQIPHVVQKRQPDFSADSSVVHAFVHACVRRWFVCLLHSLVHSCTPS